ncbi:acetyl-CoA synthetase-like protein [Calocera viscosa TUFC12733]|uniref:Acetyl-CoA synthetase-like protein n=1 Tax=Calocera viscosa (strain TUFC12733) TaxID=1330018 RepID=A0A167IKW3_CALVF|nr:acetyl-CoA synthetase-like protein [Calocera viscosa TUFC12733]
MSQIDVSSSNVSYVPSDNLFAYLFHNREVWRRFAVPDNKVIFHEPTTSQDLRLGRLRDDSLRFAKSLSRLVAGVPAKDDFGVPGALVGPVVMIHLPNCVAFPVIFFGGLAAKCVMNLVSPALGPQELAHVMELVQPDVVFTQPGNAGEDILRKALPLLPQGWSEPKIFTVDVTQYPTDSILPRSAPSNNWLNLLNVDTSFRVAPMSAHEQANRVACILWSSGTTGKSKGVMHSHRALVTTCVLWQKHAVALTPDERWIGLPPFYHIMGLQTIILLAPLYGCKIILMRNFDLETYLRLIVKHRVTYLNLAPPLALVLTKTPLLDEPWCDITSIRSAGCGAAPLGGDIIREFYRRTRIPILMGYGASETGCFTHRPDQTWANVERHLGYSGRIMPDVEIQIRDEAGQSLPSGKPGEIMMRSNLQMLGYVRNPKANAEAFSKDGFVHTGDIGILSNERYIKIVDRIKDVMKYKGFQVSPVELDAVIGALSSVLDVGTTSIYSEKHASELPRAYVVPRSSELVEAVKRGDQNHPGLRAFASQIFKTVEEQCAYYKWLRGGIVLSESIPKSPTGKILRRSLKDIKGVYVPYTSKPEVRARL